MEITSEAPGTFTPDQIDTLVRKAAGHGDSSHQWSWHSTGTLVELRADLPPVADPCRRTLLLDVGRILLNLRVLIKGLGARPVVRLFPDLGRRDLVATMALQGARRVTDQDRVLTAAVLSGGRPVGPSAGRTDAARRRTVAAGGVAHGREPVSDGDLRFGQLRGHFRHSFVGRIHR